MFFTQDDYKKIQQWLIKNSVKDTEFNEANIPFNGEETITIVQGNQNKKVFLKDLIAQVFNLGISDFVNITDKYDAPNISLEEAIRLIPSRARKEGQVITFLDREDHWHIYQFKGVLNQWNVLDTWEDLFDWKKLINNSILPDEEDLTKSSADENGNSYLSLKDREYNPEDFSGLGRVILRKNIVEVENPTYGKVKKNILYQDMFTQSNTIYEIRYDFDLNGAEIAIPEGCVLDFQGGSFSNGGVKCNKTLIAGHYLKSKSVIKGFYFIENNINSLIISDRINNVYVVSTGEELQAILSKEEKDICIYLKGDIFILNSTTQIKNSGCVVPYPGYSPQIIIGKEIENFEDDITNNDYVMCDANVYSGRYFNLFDEQGNEIAVQKLSDIIGCVPITNESLYKNKDIISIKMTSKIASVISNVSKDILQKCILRVNAGWTTIQLDGLYTDSEYIYGTPYIYEPYPSLFNYEYATYGVGASYEIYNLPIYGNGNAFVDSNNKLHIPKKYSGKIIVSNIEKGFTYNNSNEKHSFYNITFKGSCPTYYFECDTSSNKKFVNCKFTSVFNCFYTIGKDNYNIYFENCEFRNIGGRAIYIRGANNKIVNCRFNKQGLIAKEAPCIFILGLNNIVAKNHICDFSYVGIYSGLGNIVDNSGEIYHNIIEQNEFKENPRKYVLRDGGGIYIHTRNTNLIVKENVIRHLTCYPSSQFTYDNRGIFLDDGAYGVTVAYNLIYDIPSYALDARYVPGDNTSKNNKFLNNIIYGSIRIQGNINCTEAEMNAVSGNILSCEHNMITNEMVVASGNIITCLSEIDNTILIPKKIYGVSDFIKNYIRFIDVPNFKIGKNSVSFAYSKDETKYINIYCPTINNKETPSDYGVYYMTYLISLSTDYELYPSTTIKLNVVFNYKLGKHAIVDAYGIVSPSTYRARIEKITTVTINEAKASNQGFLLNLKFLPDGVKDTFVNIRLENVSSLNGFGLPATTYLLFEETSSEKDVEVLSIPLKSGTERPIFTNGYNTKYIGFKFFDTALNKPIWWTGSKWVDATGADV